MQRLLERFGTEWPPNVTHVGLNANGAGVNGATTCAPALAMARAARMIGRDGLADLLSTISIPTRHIARLLSLSCDADSVTDAACLVIASGLARHAAGDPEWRSDRALALKLLDGDGERFDRMAGEVRALLA